MTREQAINYLISSGFSEEQVSEVVRALTYQPTTKNDLGVDCISRDVVKNYIQAHIHEIITESGEDKNKHTNRVLRSLIHGVNCMPSVTPQERKGQWIECMPGGAEEWCYKCSECNFWKYKKTINLSKFKFCPNCGADMRGEE